MASSQQVTGVKPNSGQLRTLTIRTLKRICQQPWTIQTCLNKWPSIENSGERKVITTVNVQTAEDHDIGSNPRVWNLIANIKWKSLSLKWHIGLQQQVNYSHIWYKHSLILGFLNHCKLSLQWKT
jgi:hypothetical protein